MKFQIIILVLFLSAFFVIVSPTVSAEWDDRGYFYTLSGDPLVATITGYNGSGGSLSIPATVGPGEYRTVAINDSAFSSNSNIISVSLPLSITTLGDNSFKQCSALTSVIMGTNVTTIGDSAFKLCTSLTSITFLGLVAPTSVGTNWIQNTPSGIQGHAYPSSNFPPPGGSFYGLTMGDCLIENTPPTFLDPAPVNQSTGVSRYPPSNVTVNDEEGDAMNVYFWYSISNTPYVWVNVQQNDTVPANSTVRVLNSSYASAWNTQYWWKVTADDGDENASVIYTFRTKSSNAPPIVGAPTPANGSTGTLQGFSWNIPLNDPEGDPMNWTIQCSNTQAANANGASNGTQALALTGLAPLTTYTIWVNATDPTGSHVYTRRWFTFSTKSAGGTPPGGGTSENQKPIADLSAGAPYHGFIGLPFLCNGLHSHDPDGIITQWSWMFGDTTNGTGETIWHTYASAGTYTITLTVTDDDGATDTATTTCVIIQPNSPPTPPLLTGPETGTRETMYTFTAVVFDDDNDTIQYSIVWGDDPATPDVSVFLPNGTVFTGRHQWMTAGRYTITVTATDARRSSTATKIIWIDAVDLAPLGYLLDRDGDGSYEVFQNESTDVSTTVGRRGSTYLVDTDGDGTWEYTFDAVAGLSPYQESETSQCDLTSIVGMILISVICALVVLIVVLRRKGYF